MLHKPDPGWGSRRDRAAPYVDDLKVAQLKQGSYSDQNHMFSQLWTQTNFTKYTPVAVYLILHDYPMWSSLIHWNLTL